MQISNDMHPLIRKYCKQIRKQHQKDLDLERDDSKKHWDIPAMVTICHDKYCIKRRRGYSHSPKGVKWNINLKIIINKLGDIGGHSKISPYILGRCSEQISANNYMNYYNEKNINNLYFTESVRPRTMQVFPSCGNCKYIFPNL